MAFDVNNTHPNPEMLQAFLSGRLGDVERVEIEAHVLECEHCGDSMQKFREADPLSNLAKQCLGSATDGSCANPVTIKPIDSEIPQSLREHPRYEVLEVVGRGGMGVVYRARHRLMDRDVAIKVIDQRLIGRQEAKDQFLIEVKAAAKLSHPNIVAAFDAESRGELLFLAMELVEGEVLSETVKRGGPMQENTAIRMVEQAALGLSHAHSQGLVHRDIKPSNLLLCKDEQNQEVVKILDFGLASFQPEEAITSMKDAALDGAGRESSDRLTGTLNYISPEQFEQSGMVDQRSDIFSLGCTFHYLLTGASPFEDSRPLLERAVNPGFQRWQQKKVDGLDPKVQRILDRMLAISPGERFSSVQELLTEIASAKGSEKPDKNSLIAKPLMLAVLMALLLAIFYPIFSNWQRGAEDTSGTIQKELLGRTALFVLPSTDIWIGDYQPVRDVLDEKGVSSTVASTVYSPTTTDEGEERGQLKVDLLISECDAAQYDIIVVCGGHWHDDLNQSDAILSLTELLDQQCRERQPIAAICGGQVPLGELGFLEDIDAADPQQPWVNDDWQANWVSQAPVVWDQNILTASDPDHANAFAAEICNLLEQISRH